MTPKTASFRMLWACN